MRKASSLLLTMVVIGCSGVEDFERDLRGASADAWKLCKQEFDVSTLTPPINGEVEDGHILFAWDVEEAEERGGPIMCQTNGDGTELIEVHSAGTPFG